MIVYVLITNLDEPNYCIVGVYSTKEKALEAIQRNDIDDDPEYTTIEEYEIDQDQ